MPTLPIAEWTSALDRMTAALSDLLTDLDRTLAEASHSPERPVAAKHPRVSLADAEDTFLRWDEQLNAATGLAASLEGQLKEREDSLRRWGESFERWRELIKQGGAEPSTSLG